MQGEKLDIINQLKRDILCLQGFKPVLNNTALDDDLGPIAKAFPNASFPVGAVHEFLYKDAADAPATNGFVSAVLSGLMNNGGAALWISSLRTVFPPAFKFFGIEPDRIIFIDLKKQKDVLWAMEEALKCSGLAAVVGEVSEMNFTASRRLQLAVEQSRVTGFILRRHPRKLNATACVSRWTITSVPSSADEDLPGVGFPRWRVELLKARNGKPGVWEVEWMGGQFRHEAKKVFSISRMQKKKAV
jgi:protein ImuA